VGSGVRRGSTRDGQPGTPTVAGESLEGFVAAVAYVLGGVALLLTAILPRLLGRALTPAMVFVGAGFLSSFLPGARPFHPQNHLALVEHVTELCVIVALLGVGLALDRPFSVAGWSSTWRLLLIAMPLFIALLGVAAWGLAGLAPGASLLLAAVLAPTDPVLAADVRVGEPTDDPDSEDELRFALSSEAGANDGLAFPFVHASMLLLTIPAAQWLGGWMAWELVGKVVLGVACGVTVGYLFARAAFRAPLRVLRFAETAESVVSLAVVFLAYGVAELVGGYGFLSVFAAGLALRAQERGHEFHRTMHEFIALVERLLTMGLLLVFGYSLGSGLLANLTWQGALLGLAAVLVVRPLVGTVAMYRSTAPVQDRRSIAFFGVRGIGSFYYLAFATGSAQFPDPGMLWSTVSFTVLVSVVVHGSTAAPILRRIDRRLGRRTPEPV
jgi:NhaP-type Na+/H+ or K+/H+ antiporter